MCELGSVDIARLLGRGYPMILIDKVTSVVANHSCSAFKNLTFNEWFFPQHFPDHPIMPGSLQIECFTQVVALPLLLGRSDRSINRFPLVFAGADKIRFYSPVRPGDRLDLYAEIKRDALGVVVSAAEGYVSGKKVSECQIIYRNIETR